MNSADAAQLRQASIRLAVRFAALILVLLAIVIGVMFAIVSAGQAEATTNTLANAGMVDSPHDAPRNVDVAIVEHGSTIVSGGAPSWFPVTSLLEKAAASDHPIESTMSVGGRTYAIRTDADHGRVVQAALDTQENAEELQRLAVGVIVAGILAVIGAGFIAAFIARRTMRPMVDALGLQRRFVADASHELRTPLTLLSTRAQLLRRHVADPESASGLDEILQDTRDLAAILEDLLIAADPRESAAKVEIDLSALADDVVASLQPDAESRGLALTRSGDPSVDIDGAQTSLRRLFTALISNALDHARTTVTVDIRAAGKFAAVRVTDDGPGFPAGMTTRAFERFATSRPTEDTFGASRHYGLGLALVADVAAQHDGTVTIEPMNPGAGARILVMLPLHAR
jgi:two-component system OmpR family sensor kinase